MEVGLELAQPSASQSRDQHQGRRLLLIPEEEQMAKVFFEELPAVTRKYLQEQATAA